MLTKIRVIFKMIGLFFVEIYELLTGKRKFMQQYDPEDDELTEEDSDDEEEER